VLGWLGHTHPIHDPVRPELGLDRGGHVLLGMNQGFTWSMTRPPSSTSPAPTSVG